MREPLPRRTVTFVVRFWAEYLEQFPPIWRGEVERVGDSNWYGEVEPVQSRRCDTFRNLDELLDILRAMRSQPSFSRKDVNTMATIKKTITINAPAEKVFAYMTDPTNLPEIWPSLVEVKDVKQLPEGVGSGYRWVYKMAGMRFEGTTEVTEYVPNQRIVVRDKGGIETTRTTTFQPEDGGTRLTAEAEYTIPVPVLGKLAEAFVLKLNEHEAETLLANLKARMES